MIRKIRLISKFIKSQPGKQFNTHIVQYLRSKGNQTMKFDQLLEYVKHFFEKLFTKCCGQTIHRPFSKQSKLSLSLDQYSKF